MIKQVKHLVQITYIRIDVRELVKQVRAEYREFLVGENSRVARGEVLWDRFEAAATHCIGNPKSDESQLTEVINEIAVASLLAKDKALEEKQIEYEPTFLPDGRKIDFIVNRGQDNLYVEVKTVRTRSLLRPLATVRTHNSLRSLSKTSTANWLSVCRTLTSLVLGLIASNTHPPSRATEI